MSTPLHPHKLRQEQEKGAGGEYVAGRYAQMRCDSTTMLNCPLPPIRAPRLVVYPRTLIAGAAVFIAKPIYTFTTLHYCERHRRDCTVEKLLRAKIAPWRAGTILSEIENLAKRQWSHDLVPDLDNARIEWMLTTTPEYRDYLVAIENGMKRDPWTGMPLL
jgi:hypothetical protein